MLYIFSFTPYGKNNLAPKTWHLCLFNWWINTGIPITKLSRKYHMSLTYDKLDRTLGLLSYGVKPNRYGDSLEDEDYFYKGIRLFGKTQYKKQFLTKDNKWMTDVEFTANSEAMRLSSLFKKEQIQEYHPVFKFFENNKRIVVKPTVTAERRYYGYDFLPKKLKWLGATVQETIWIEFNDEIGPERGSWKGGVTALSYPFTKNLATSWLNFEYFELPKYIRTLR